MAKQVPVEIKANVVKHFLATKCTFEALLLTSTKQGFNPIMVKDTLIRSITRMVPQGGGKKKWVIPFYQFGWGLG